MRVAVAAPSKAASSRFPAALLFLAATVLPQAVLAQTNAEQVRKVLQAPIASADVVAFQLRNFLLQKAPALPRFDTAQAWTAHSEAARKRILEQIVYHGWPKEWVDSPSHFEQTAKPIEGKGYRIRKLRYEIVPGFFGAALLYEPAKVSGKVPAVLNVNGHVGPPGKAIEYKQKRCINQALQGMLSLNLEWFAFGELSAKENVHWFGAHLDLVGANGVGLFYLAMRRGLDYLESHPNADRTRLAVTGLSGGGWQTIFLSALDPRVAVSVPVAGYSSIVSRIERAGDTGDLEQNPTDLLTIADYPELTAMRAPRPTLLAYNAEDDCCFRAALVKPYIFDFIRPAFKLYGKEDAFDWHTNRDPGNHNYQLDNRLASYRFMAKHFHLPASDEVDVSADVKSPEELAVGLPRDNLTILGVARKLASERKPAGGSSRDDLRQIVRYRPVGVQHVWPLTNASGRGLDAESLRIDFNNGLSATGVWMGAPDLPSRRGPIHIVLSDSGKAANASEISEILNRGERVLALDVMFLGDAAPQHPEAFGYAQMISTLGERPLGLMAAEVNATAKWLAQQSPSSHIRLSSFGPRAQVTSLVAAALEPNLYNLVQTNQGFSSLQAIIDKPVEYELAPELFCLDLYRSFDIPQLLSLANARRSQ